MKPILKDLLIHSVTFKKVSSKDAWGNETLTNSNLTFVRVDPTTQLVQDKDNQKRKLTHLLFYDAVNSSGLPSGQVFEVNDNITFNGREHVIITVEELYDRNKLHHYELGLI